MSTEAVQVIAACRTTTTPTVVTAVTEPFTTTTVSTFKPKQEQPLLLIHHHHQADEGREYDATTNYSYTPDFPTNHHHHNHHEQLEEEEVVVVDVPIQMMMNNEEEDNVGFDAMDTVNHLDDQTMTLLDTQHRQQDNNVDVEMYIEQNHALAGVYDSPRIDDLENDENDDCHDDRDDDHWRLSNAVHIEMQENARLPTFHWNVNRAGSSSTTMNNKMDITLQQFLTNVNHAATTTTTAVNNNNNDTDHHGTVRKSRSNTMDDLSISGDTACSVNLEDFLQLDDDSSVPTLHLPPLNLTELFLNLESGQRHTNFPTHKSSCYYNTDTGCSGNPVEEDDTMVDPTPLSEIKRKFKTTTTTDHHRHPTTTTTTSTEQPPVTIHNYNTTYWTRPEPLPIPSPVPPLTVNVAENDDTNTGVAAAGDSVVTTIQNTIGPDSSKNNNSKNNTNIPTSLQQSNASTALGVSLSTTEIIPQVTTATTMSDAYRMKSAGSGKTQPQQETQHSTVHSKSRPAVQVASQKRTQYGFGPKHVVPSVPTTSTVNHHKNNNKNSTTATTTTKVKATGKSNPRTSRNRNQTNTTVATATAKSTTLVEPPNGMSYPPVIVRAPSITSHGEDDSGSDGGGNGGVNGGSSNSASNVVGNVAYERKKERAKTARIRLNESIDRLQIALHMAGTQSNQRLSMFQEQTVPYRIISDCIKCSEDAKKWDRPSFVGSAATMIQGLNAQCEALVRALHDERHARAEQDATTMEDHTKSTFPSKPPTATIGASDVIEKAITNQKHHCSSSPSDAEEGIGSQSSKRFKAAEITNERGNSPHAADFMTQISTGCRAIKYLQLNFAVFADKSMLVRIASFLDPLSLIRCQGVCRDWKNGGVFSSDLLWQRLAIDRFGSYNVRQWLTKTEDFVQQDMHVATNLYKTMDTNNIMPHCPLDGMLLLGESRLLGKISAWTYLVERSNGETMRSVERHSSMPGTGVYTSLPVVQLRTIIQNTGIHDDTVIIREQLLTVDASTRRRGEEMVEIDWDNRFRKRILNLDGTMLVQKKPAGRASQSIYRELCRLRLFEAVVLETSIHARGCPTISKFVQKSNLTKVLVQIRDGTTVPLVIPFPRDASHLLQ
jgi:hypothetical protein